MSSGRSANLARDEELARRMQEEEDHIQLQSNPFMSAMAQQMASFGMGSSRPSGRTRSRRAGGGRTRHGNREQDFVNEMMAQVFMAMSGGGGQLVFGGGEDQPGMDLMRRELTAEDYDRLLQLDPQKNEGASHDEVNTLPVFTFGAAPAASSSSSSSTAILGRKRPRSNVWMSAAGVEVVDLASSQEQDKREEGEGIDGGGGGGEAGLECEQSEPITPHTHTRHVRLRGSLSGSKSSHPINLAADDGERDMASLGNGDGNGNGNGDGVGDGVGGSGERIVVLLVDTPTAKDAAAASKARGGDVQQREEDGKEDKQEARQEEEEEEEEKCCICMAAYERGEELMRLPCFHCFHSECSRKWLVVKASCPVCNERLDLGYAP